MNELEAEQVNGAGRYERSEPRRTERNGSRPRVLTTKAGYVQLAIRKLRKDSSFSEILAPRRRIDQALCLGRRARVAPRVHQAGRTRRTGPEGAKRAWST